MSKGDWEGLSMQVSLEYHPYKIFIGKSELSGQAMGGFENLITPCVGKSIEQGILFLVELSGMQPDSNSSTAQISLLLHVRAAETFATMEPNNQAKVSGEEDKFELPNANVCTLHSSAGGHCPECPGIVSDLRTINSSLGKASQMPRQQKTKNPQT